MIKRLKQALPGERGATAIFILLFAFFGVLSQRYDLLKFIDNSLLHTRASIEMRAPSGDVVLLAVDSATIDLIGQWPWPRSVYSQVISRLNRYQAGVIAFDIDFSTRSFPDEDRKFADSVRDSRTPVILAVFQQRYRAENGGDTMKFNTPIAELESHAWLASVNVNVDELGLVRSVPAWAVIDRDTVPSLAVMLSGHSESSNTAQVNIDFSIDPSGIPVYSLSDLLQDKIDPDRLRDKAVLIGATAIELRDTLAVPVHQVLAGPFIHILAAETIKQDRSLAGLNLPVYAVAMLFLLALFQFAFSRPYLNSVPGGKLALLIVGVALIEFAAFRAYADHAVVVQTASLNVVLCVFTLNDILRQLEFSMSKLLESVVRNRRMKTIINRVVDDNNDAIVIADTAGKIELFNNKAREIFGVHQKLEGVDVEQVLPPNLVSLFRDIASNTSDQGAIIRSEFTFDAAENEKLILTALFTSVSNTADGQDGDGSKRYICATISDRTHERLAQRQIEFLANHDAVTGGLTRQSLADHIQDNSWYLASHNASLIVLHIHNLHSLAQLYGIDIKHRTLKAVYDKIRSSCRDQPLARLQDDALALLERNSSQKKISDWCRRIQSQFGEPIMIDGHQMRVDIGIGAVASWQGFDNSEQFVQAAEMVLDEIRYEPNTQLTFFDIKKSLLTSRRLALENHLRVAISNGEIEILYQEQVDLKSRRFVGAEALVRWTQEEFGPVSPVEFIPIAEKSGAIVDIGKYVIEQACRKARSWPGDTVVSVNVSPVQLISGDFYGIVRQALKSSGLAANRLCLEITETEFLERNQGAVDTLHDIRRLGVSIALDDFGTGFSSFEYISRLPIDKVKIDRFFIDAKEISDRNIAVIKSITELARGLNIGIVCEGVEHEEQASLLLELGCETGQGYLFGRPQKLFQFDSGVELKTA